MGCIESWGLAGSLPLHPFSFVLRLYLSLPPRVPSPLRSAFLPVSLFAAVTRFGLAFGDAACGTLKSGLPERRRHRKRHSRDSFCFVHDGRDSSFFLLRAPFVPLSLVSPSALASFRPFHRRPCSSDCRQTLPVSLPSGPVAFTVVRPAAARN